MPEKSNDVLEEQIKMLYKMSEESKKDFLGALTEIKNILNEMRSEFVTREQLKATLELHEEKSKARHDKLESDIVILKRIIYTLGAGVLTALGKSFAGLFSLIIK